VQALGCQAARLAVPLATSGSLTSAIRPWGHVPKPYFLSELFEAVETALMAPR
jgi:hypothetical protein